MVVEGNRGVLVLFWLFSAFFIQLFHHPRWVGVQVLVRGARAFSCDGALWVI